MFKIAIALVVLVAAGCSSSGPSSARGYELRVRYAEITGVERVQLPSAMPAGAIVGGFTGLMLSHRQAPGRQLAGGLGGAALGALATRALEGDRLGFGYTLSFRDGVRSQFITEKGYLQLGDCVAVERGQHANIRRVPDDMCRGNAPVQVATKHIKDAEQCAEAKDQLLAAVSDEEINAASRKVKILCEF